MYKQAVFIHLDLFVDQKTLSFLHIFIGKLYTYTGNNSYQVISFCEKLDTTLDMISFFVKFNSETIEIVV